MRCVKSFVMFVKKKRQDFKEKGYMKPATVFFIAISVIILVLSVIVGTKLGVGLRQRLHDISPLEYAFDVDAGYKELFLFLWGFNQAILFYYLEHRKDKLLGISVYRIIQRSIGVRLPFVVMMLFIVEFFLWGIGIIISNKVLLFTDFLLQGINILVILWVVMNKYEVNGVLGSCKKDAMEYKIKWYSQFNKRRGKKRDNIDANNGQDLLLFDLLAIKEEFTSEIEDNIKLILKKLFAAGDGKNDNVMTEDFYSNEDKARCEFIVSILEKMLSGNSDTLMKRFPYIMGWCFEADSDIADEIARKAILYYMVKSERIKHYDIIHILGLRNKKDVRAYGWCGIWQLYWMEYQGSNMGLAYVNEYKEYAGNISFGLEEFRLTSDADRMILLNAIERWNSIREVVHE